MGYRCPVNVEDVFTPGLRLKWLDYYEDVCVLEFPAPVCEFRMTDIPEKALYYSSPFTSMPGVKPFLPSFASYNEPAKGATISQDKIIDVSRYLKPDSTMDWKVPGGNWTINAHMASFTGKLIQKTGVPDKKLQGGLKMLHMDSWEMGALSWTATFRGEFKKRRGYDPLPFYPVYSGMVVESLVKSECFFGICG